MSTTHFTNITATERWLLYDASNQVLGRLASDIAMKLIGKDLPSYTPNALTGAFVVVVNAEKIVVTGNKAQAKTYEHYTGYPGGQRSESYASLQKRRPDEIIREAVRRMLPKTILGRGMLSRLKIYSGAEHKHSAQQPVKVEFKSA
ncbi:MAG: 50S ribosomal protein L13 [Planctomycetes bacterium]|nr:50S ribosomal protein L13 [Planctomycetota bacterium]